jgi:hypothetical protein
MRTTINLPDDTRLQTGVVYRSVAVEPDTQAVTPIQLAGQTLLAEVVGLCEVRSIRRKQRVSVSEPRSLPTGGRQPSRNLSEVALTSVAARSQCGGKKRRRSLLSREW